MAQWPWGRGTVALAQPVVTGDTLGHTMAWNSLAATRTGIPAGHSDTKEAEKLKAGGHRDLVTLAGAGTAPNTGWEIQHCPAIECRLTPLLLSTNSCQLMQIIFFPVSSEEDEVNKGS